MSESETMIDKAAIVKDPPGAEEEQADLAPEAVGAEHEPPAGESPADTAAEPRRAKPVRRAGGARVLFYHEDKDSLSHYLDVLGICGLKNCDTASRIRDAMELLISKHYDLVLVTYSGNGQAADQLIDELKSLEATAFVPLMAIASDGRPKNVLRIMSKGVDHVLVTPLSKKKIVEAATKVLRPEDSKIEESVLAQAAEMLQNERFDEAENLYKSLLACDAANIDAHRGLAEVKRLQGDNQSAQTLLQIAMKAAKSLPDKVEQCRKLARVFHFLGDFFVKIGRNDQAIKHYRAALTLNPFHSETWPDLFEVMPKEESVEQILEFVTEVRQNFTPFTTHLDTLAAGLEGLIKRYHTLGMQENVDLIYQQLCDLLHNDVGIHMQVADYWLASGQYCRTERLLARLCKKIKDADLLDKLAEIYVCVGRKQYPENNPAEGFEVDISAFSELSPEQLLDKAYHLFRESLLLEPYDLRSWLNLARCHVWKHEHDLADESLQRFLESLGEPDAGVFVQIGEMLMDEQAYDIAGKYIEEGIKHFADDSRFYLLQGRLCNARGEHYEAISALKRALRDSAEDIEVIAELADTYSVLAHWTEAVEFYEKGQQVAPDNERIQQGLQKALRAKCQE